MLRKFHQLLLNDPKRIVLAVLSRFASFLPDHLYLKLYFRISMGHRLDLNAPKTFTEKIQRLKLYNRKPEYTLMVDKYEVKKYVANIIGEEYIIPTLGVWDKFEDIKFEELPDKFVLKTTHGGGNTGVVICQDKTAFNISEANNILNKSLKLCIYKNLREWPYKNVKRRIIAEQFLECKGHVDLPDYKFYCFNGVPKYCQVIRDRNSLETIDFYDMEWNHMPFIGLNPMAKNGITPVPKPKSLDCMIDICHKLASDIPFTRIDLFVINDKIYFGEITFYPASGFGCFTPQEWDCKLGKLIKLNI